MPNFCQTCGRRKHKGLCDMATLSDGRTVHVNRIDRKDGDVAEQIKSGAVKIVNRWIKPPKAAKKKAASKPRARKT